MTRKMNDFEILLDWKERCLKFLLLSLDKTKETLFKEL